MFCPLFFVVVGFLAMHGSEGSDISPSPQVFPADPIGNAAASPPVTHGNLRSANAPSSLQFSNAPPPTISPSQSVSTEPRIPNIPPSISPSSTPSQLPKKHEGSAPSSPAIKSEPPTSPPVTDFPPTSISSPPPIPPIPKEASNGTSGDTQAPINTPAAPALPLPAEIPVKPPTPHPPAFAPPPVSTGLPSKALPRVAPSPKEITPPAENNTNNASPALAPTHDISPPTNETNNGSPAEAPSKDISSQLSPPTHSPVIGVAPSPKEITPPAENDTNNASPALAPTHDISPPTNETNNGSPAEAPSKDISSQLSPPTHSPVIDDSPPSSSVSSPLPVPPITRGADNGTSPANSSMGSAFVPVPSPPLEIPTRPPAAQPNISVPPPLPIESPPNNDLPPQSNIFAPPPLSVGLPHNNDLQGPSASPTTSVSPALNRTHNNVPAKAPSKDIPSHLSPPQPSPIKGIVPVSSPKPHNSVIPSSVAPTPLVSRSRQKKRPDQPPAFPPLGSDQNSGKKDGKNKSFTPTNHRVPVVAPVPSLLPPPAVPKNNQSQKASSPIQEPSAAKPPKLPVIPKDSPAPLPLHAAPSNKHHRPTLAPDPSSSVILPSVPSNRTHSPLQSPVSSPVESPPVSSPSISLPVKAMPPQVPPAQSPKPIKRPKQLLTPSPAPAAKLRKGLPPPPPNLDCTLMTCVEPLTNSPPGSPCACVRPMKVGLRLSVALYTFFPLVSELAQEIASGTFMKQSQVRIMGANAATEQPDKTIVLVDLVPLGQKFDRTTAFLTSERFWHKQVGIKASYFGDYDVLYVMYPGLPPSPPISPLSTSGSGGSFGNENNSRRIHPLGVDVRKRKEKLGGSLIAIIILSSVVALVLSVGIAWFLFIKPINRNRFSSRSPETPLPLSAKALGMAGNGPVLFGSCPTSASASFSSNVAPYSGSAKTFSAAEIEKATNKLDDSRVIGEGGFGCVYEGILEDGTKVAVKVLKRDDHQGSREFLAEVEMLSRLHHRNLVKLIGICTEEHLRCLVYELIPNGSVESHLHGADKEIALLDWSTRIKIALGSARGLAYLHEDSNPRVIHRDFKSSNILLENDFTPKVSDFGLARTALDDGNGHISTRVMGTFGYVAPEYAMTGHLLVKSDVYSYGVVLLELLTGRKPVNMLQPPGQENLVTWARPLLTSREDLEMIIDPALGSDLPFDSVAKVAAIASMCVQPEVSHRPFMGEVVQALKLVCNENDEHRPSESGSQADAVEHDPDMNISGDLIPEGGRVLSASEIFSTSAPLDRDKSGSLRRHSSSGPIRTSRSGQFWSRLKGFSRGSVSEHGGALGSSSSTQRWP